MPAIEQIVRPFSTKDVEPTPFTTPGAVGVPPVYVPIGLRGGTKTFAWSLSVNQTYYLTDVRQAKAPDNGWSF